MENDQILEGKSVSNDELTNLEVSGYLKVTGEEKTSEFTIVPSSTNVTLEGNSNIEIKADKAKVISNEFHVGENSVTDTILKLWGDTYVNGEQVDLSKINDYNTQIQALEGDVSDLNTEINNLKSDVNTLEGRIKNLEDSQSTAQTKLEVIEFDTEESSSVTFSAEIVGDVYATMNYFYLRFSNGKRHEVEYLYAGVSSVSIDDDKRTVNVNCSFNIHNDDYSGGGHATGYVIANVKKS